MCAKLFATTLVVADFEPGRDPVSIGASSSLSSTDVTIVTTSYAAHLATEPAHGSRGYSLKIQHLTTGDGYLTVNFGTSLDLRGYRSLSFWVRGNAGSEHFKLDLRRATPPNEPDSRPNIRNFIVGEISPQWQKVNIPIKAIFKELLTVNYNALSDVNGIVFNFTDTTPVETLYIDDISFHTEPGNVMVDQFDDGSNPTTFGYNPFDYRAGGTGDSLGISYDATNTYGSSAYALKLAFGTGTVLPSDAVALVEVDTRSFAAGGIGVDITGCDTLSFKVKGEANADGKFLGVGLGDDANTERIHATSITLTTSYQDVTRALSGFDVSKDSISEVEFWFLNSDAAKGPPISTISSATVYIDVVRFLDTSTPTTPTSLLKNSSALSANSALASTDTLSVTADAASSDATIERVRFEHDGLTGGTTWFVLGVDTDTADGTYTTELENFSSLQGGTSYQIRAVAEDVAGNVGRMSAVSNLTMPLVNPVTGFVGTVGTTTSIVWSWVDNSDSEDGFRVFASSGGQVSPDLTANTTFWNETSLSPNTQYSRYARPFSDGISYPVTSAVSKFTFSHPVSAVTLFERSNTSITIAWSTGTGGNGQFSVLRAGDVQGSAGTFASVAGVGGNTFQYRDGGLMDETTYWYRIVGYNGDRVAASSSPALMAVTNGGPEFVHTPLTSIGVSGKDVILGASVSSKRSLQGVQLLYRQKGESSFNSVSFLPALSVGALTYSGKATLAASFIQDSLSSDRFEYMLTASDTVKTSSHPSSGLHVVTVAETLSASVGSEGGTVSLEDGDSADGSTTIEIPSGSLNQTMQVTLKQLDAASVDKRGGAVPQSAYRFGPSGLQFKKAVTMKLLYFDKDQNGVVDGANISEKDLRLFWFDGSEWRNLGGSVDSANNIVSGKVSHFSTFALFEGTDPQEADVRPKEKIITPNGDGMNDFAQFGASGDFEIKIFDVQGKRMRKLENISIWDGREENGEMVESGVYIYRVKSGKLNVSGTIGVAR